MNTSEMARLSVRDLLYVFFKRRNLIILFFAAAVMLGVLANFLMLPKYKATAQILVKVDRADFFMSHDEQSSPQVRLAREELINSEIEILMGTSLTTQVAESMGPGNIFADLNETESSGGLRSFLREQLDALRQRLALGSTSELEQDESGEEMSSPLKRATARLQGGLTVEGIPKSNVIQVTFVHHDPRTAAQVLNRLIDLYLDRHIDVHKVPHSSEFFQEQSLILRDKLDKSQDRLRTFKRAYDVVSLDEERQLMLRQESDLRKSYGETSSAIAEVESRIEKLKEHLSQVPATIVQSEQVEHNPAVVTNLQARLVELELEEKELLTRYTPQSRMVQNVKEELALLKSKLRELESRRHGRSHSGVNPTYQRLQEELYKSQADLEALTAKERAQQAQVEEYGREFKKFDEIEVQFNRLSEEVALDQKNYTLYLTKFEESRISNAMDAEKIGNVSVIEPAQPPLRPFTPNKSLNMLLAVFFGIFGSIGLAFLLELIDDGLEKPEEVEKIMQLPVLASIPEFKH